MAAGMAILNLLDSLTSDAARYAVIFEYGTNTFDLAMAIFMTVPMVAWMLIRDHSWRPGAEMAFAMLVPVAVIVVLRVAGVGSYLPWLDDASHMTMLPAMIIAMLYRRDHYSSKPGHAAQSVHE